MSASAAPGRTEEGLCDDVTWCMHLKITGICAGRVTLDGAD